MRKIIALLCLLAAQPVFALTNMLTWGAANPSLYNSATQCMLVAKGVGNDNLYAMEADSTTGALAVTFATSTKTMSYKDRHDYTVNVTTAAYTELIASTAAAIYVLNIFDSSGETMILATGAAASETDLLYIPPGGFNAPMEIYIAAGTRLSIKALSATATSGEIVINATN